MMMMDPTKVVGWSYHQYEEEEEVEEGEIVGTVPQLVNKLKDTHKSVIKTMPQLVNVNLQDIVNFSKVLTDTIISLDKAVMMKKTTAAAATAAAAMPDNYQWIQNKMDGIIFDIKQLQHQLLQTVSHTAVGNNIIIISIISLSLSLSLSLLAKLLTETTTAAAAAAVADKKRRKKATCPNCSKVFAARKSMLQHHRAQHQGVRYPCDQCDYKATQRGDLKKHNNRYHKK